VAVAEQPRIQVLEDHVVWSLYTDRDRVSQRTRCSGALVLDVHGGRWLQVDARAVVTCMAGAGFR
jgi:succinate dehydrogenase/fumarate reductase flavoprotein subunit